MPTSPEREKLQTNYKPQLDQHGDPTSMVWNTILILPTFTLVTLWRSLSSTELALWEMLAERNLSWRNEKLYHTVCCWLWSSKQSVYKLSDDNDRTENIIILYCSTCNGVPYQHTAYHGWSSMILLLLHGMRIDKKHTHTVKNPSRHIT